MAVVALRLLFLTRRCRWEKARKAAIKLTAFKRIILPISNANWCSEDPCYPFETCCLMPPISSCGYHINYTTYTVFILLHLVLLANEK